MRKVVLAAVFVFTLPWSGQAAPLCVAGTLADYIALGAGGCEVGQATVAGFMSTSLLGGAVEILPGDVNVTPDAGGTALDFGLGLSAGSGQLLDILILYSVSGGSFTSNLLSLSGAAASGDGVVTAVGDTCVGGTFAGGDPTTPCSGNPLSLIVLRDQIGLISPANATFAPSSFFDVFTAITIDGGLSGAAALNGTVRNAFASVPEPSLLIIVGSGVCAALARRRRRG